MVKRMLGGICGSLEPAGVVLPAGSGRERCRWGTTSAPTSADQPAVIMAGWSLSGQEGRKGQPPSRPQARRDAAASRGLGHEPQRVQGGALPGAGRNPAGCRAEPCRVQGGTLPGAGGNPAGCRVEPCRVQGGALPGAGWNPAGCRAEPCRENVARAEDSTISCGYWGMCTPMSQKFLRKKTKKLRKKVAY